MILASILFALRVFCPYLSLFSLNVGFPARGKSKYPALSQNLPKRVSGGGGENILIGKHGKWLRCTQEKKWQKSDPDLFFRKPVLHS